MRNKKFNPDQGALFVEDQPDEDVKDVRHEERERWRVVTHSDLAADRTFRAERDTEENARAYVEQVRRLIRSQKAIIVLFRTWKPPAHHHFRLGTKRDDLVWCLWYREDGNWTADEHH